MKKILILSIAAIMLSAPVWAKTDTTSKEYLQTKKHFSIMNPIAESIAQSVIKRSLKKETGANFKVKFEGYTLSSMRKGIFKNLEITGKDVDVEGIVIPYLKVKSVSDYNWVDYTQDPVVYKTNMTFYYDMTLDEDSINNALKTKEYQNTLEKINDIAYPLFEMKGVKVRILNNKMYIITEYNFPIAPSKNNKTFMMTSDFMVENGKIIAKDVSVHEAYGNLSLNKVTNLVNLLNPLAFTVSALDTKKCKGKIENVNFVDNKIQIDGKIFVKGDRA